MPVDVFGADADGADRTLKDYSWIYEYALAHKGSPDALEALLPVPRTETELVAQPDAYYLSEMSRRIFRAGLKHSMVDAKWPAFEEVFFGFEPGKLILMSDEALEATLNDARIIRHWGKIKSIRMNALMIHDITKQHGSFGQFLADWPSEDITGLWKTLAKQGQQLGGNSTPYFLRMVGKDTFIFTDDVVAALKAQGIVTKKPSSKAELKAVQTAFSHWQQQSGRPLCQISRLLSYCVN